MAQDQSAERGEYEQLPWEDKYALLFRQIEYLHEYRFHQSSIPKGVYYKPDYRLEEFVFGDPKNPKPSVGKYRRLKNVCLYHKGSSIVHQGTMYISEQGSWQVINQDGMTVVNSTAILNEPLFTVVKQIETPIKKYDRMKRFEDIL